MDKIRKASEEAVTYSKKLIFAKNFDNGSRIHILEDGSLDIAVGGKGMGTSVKAIIENMWDRETKLAKAKAEIERLSREIKDANTVLMSNCNRGQDLIEQLTAERSLSAELARALEDIVKHQELVMKGNSSMLSTTWAIATKALKQLQTAEG